MGNTWKWINLIKTDEEIRPAIIDWGNPNIRPMSRKLDKKQARGKALLSSFDRI
jgi:hypothetical protein